MSTFTTPIFIETNPLSKEKVACGLVAVSPEQVFFKVAPHKVAIAEKLAGEVYSGYFSEHLKTLKVGLQKAEDSRKEAGTIFKDESLLDPSHFAHLKNYNAGPVQFGDIKSYAGVMDELAFEELFDELIFDEPEREQPTTPSLTKRLNARVRTPGFTAKADVNSRLPERLVPQCLTSPMVLAASVNGAARVTQGFDLDNHVDYLRKRIYENQSLQWALTGVLDNAGVQLEPMALVVSSLELSGDHADLVEKIKYYLADQFQVLTFEEFLTYADRVENDPKQRKLSMVMENLMP